MAIAGDQRVSRARLAAGVAAVAILLGLAYAPAMKGGFVWDDDRYVSENPLLTAPDGLWKIWLSTDQPSQYFPLVYTTFRIERSIWGLDVTGYHVTNLILHALDALLIGLILARLRVPGAWLAAAVFALHPVQVESVAWITERKNVLMAFFLGLSALAWIAYVDETRTGRGGGRAYARSMAFYVAALLSKTTACTFPAVQVLVVWLRGGSVDRRRWKQIAPFVLLGLAMGLFTMWWERVHQGTRPELLPLGLVERTLVASRAIWFYLGKVVWPANLAFSYPFWRIDASDPRQWLWPALCAVTAAAVWFGRKRIGRGPIAAIAMFVATLLPTSGVILLATFAYAYVADHYQYIACIGPIALLCAGGTLAAQRLGRVGAIAGPIAAALVLAALTTLTWRQARAYQGPEALWRDTLGKNPDSWMAHNNLGTWLKDHGRLDEAIVHLRRAFDIEPGLPGSKTRILYNLGNAVAQKGDLTEAESLYRRALDLSPRDASVANNLGNVLLAEGRQVDAVAMYRRAVESNPDYPPALSNLARWLAGERSSDAIREAVALGERAVALTGGRDPRALLAVANAYAAADRAADARAAAARGAALAPASTPLGAELRKIAESRR